MEFDHAVTKNLVERLFDQGYERVSISLDDLSRCSIIAWPDHCILIPRKTYVPLWDECYKAKIAGETRTADIRGDHLSVLTELVPGVYMEGFPIFDDAYSAKRMELALEGAAKNTPICPHGWTQYCYGGCFIGYYRLDVTAEQAFRKWNRRYKERSVRRLYEPIDLDKVLVY